MPLVDLQRQPVQGGEDLLWVPGRSSPISGSAVEGPAQPYQPFGGDRLGVVTYTHQTPREGSAVFRWQGNRVV